MRLTFAANNGSIGGGEVMLLRLARAARELGVEVTVVGPAAPGELLDASRADGFDTIGIPATGRASYLRNLRRWHRDRPGVLWCNGLVPGLATAGHRQRVVHLHQPLRGLHRWLARVAVVRSDAVVAPSRFVAAQVRNARVLPNWTEDLAGAGGSQGDGRRRIGFIGRRSLDKGIDVLAEALQAVDRDEPGGVELVLAGDGRFVPDRQGDAVRTALAALDGRVVDLGWAEPRDFLGRVDLVVVPSRAPESFGLVAAEAMSAGVPLVVTDAGALPEVVGPDHPWLARAGDPQSLAAAIESARRSPDGHVAAARARWEREFSPAAGTARFAELLRDLGVLPT